MSAAATLTAPAVTASAPFVGLRTFETSEASWFFGRDRETAALTRKLRSSGFTAVVGPSGSGKSSVVRAGVVPLLQQNGWREILTKPGSAPLDRLARALAQVSPEPRLAEARRFRFDATLRASAFGLADIAEALEVDAPRLLLIVDQFEELFRYGDEATGIAKAGMREEGRAFVELLLAATGRSNGRLHICVTMRSDFFGACSAYVGLAEAVSVSQFLVPLPVRAQLEQAIRNPVEKAGAAIEEALVQRLLVDVEEEQDQLPLLQHTLRRLWEHASGEPRTMREADYVTVGRIAGSIDRKAEAVQEALGTTNPVDLITLERVMKALTDLDVRDRATRRPQKRSELIALLLDGGFADRAAAEASLGRVLASLKAEDTSFVQLGDDENDPEIDIGHEALIRSWTRLAGPRHDFAAGWLRQERDDGDLWRGYVRRAEEGQHLSLRDQRRLYKWLDGRQFGEVWSRRYGGRWNELKALRTNSLRRSAALIAVVAIGLVVSSYVGWRQYWLMDLRYARQVSLSLADRSRDAAREGDSRLAALLARAALPVKPNREDLYYVVEAEDALADALSRPLETMRTSVLNEDRIFFSPDGTRMISVWGKTLYLWDAITGKPIGTPLTGHTFTVKSIAFSLDGARVVSASSDNTLRLWDAATGKPIGEPFEGHTDDVNSAAFSPDGKRIVSASDDNTLRLWDAATGKSIVEPLQGHTGPVNSAAFSPNGKLIVSASDDGTLRLWDAATGKPIREPLQGDPGGMSSAVFSPDGRRILSESRNDTLVLWDVAGRQIGMPLRGSPLKGPGPGSPPNSKSTSPSYLTPCLCAAFSSNGMQIVSASENNILRLWDAATGKPIGEPLQGHAGRVLDVAFSPDGTQIVSASSDNTLRLWDAASGKSLGAPLEGHTGSVTHALFWSDERHIVSTSDDKTLRLWEVNSTRLVGAPLQGHRDGVISAAFSPDGKLIVSASADKTLRLWDASTGRTRWNTPRTYGRRF